MDVTIATVYPLLKIRHISHTAADLVVISYQIGSYLFLSGKFFITTTFLNGDAGRVI